MDSKIKEILDKNTVDYKEIKHESFDMPIKSPIDFAHALGYDIERISKSVFLRTKTREKYVMAVCSCNKKLNFSELSKLAEVSKLEVASPDELKELVGYPIYGVSSIGLSPDIAVFMDEGLQQFDTILAGSGEGAVEIELSPDDLGKVSNATFHMISL